MKCCLVSEQLMGLYCLSCIYLYCRVKLDGQKERNVYGKNLKGLFFPPRSRMFLRIDGIFGVFGVVAWNTTCSSELKC